MYSSYPGQVRTYRVQYRLFLLLLQIWLSFSLFPAERSISDSLALAMPISTRSYLNPTQERVAYMTTNATRTIIGLTTQFEANPNEFIISAPV